MAITLAMRGLSGIMRLTSATLATITDQTWREIARIFRADPRRAIDQPYEFVELAAEALRRSADTAEIALVDSMIASYLHGAGAVARELPAVPLEQRLLAPFISGFTRDPVERELLLQSARAAWAAIKAKPSKLIYGEEKPLIEFPVIDAAVVSLINRQVVQPDDFYKLRATAKRSAFTVTAGLADEAIVRFRDVLVDVARTTTNREDFRRRMEAEFISLPVSDAHLEQVFRNNVNAAYSDGTDDLLELPQVAPGFPYRAYYAIRDARARKEHLAMEKLGLNGTNIYHYRDPVWQMFRPPWSWNSVVPETIVQGEVIFASKSWYSGQVFELITERGRRCSITKNHPVLTRNGFIPAQFLAEGIDLLGYECPVGQPVFPVNDDIDYPPARIDELFDSLRTLSGAISVETGSLDLHGDAQFGNGKVDIVATRRELLDWIESEISQCGKGRIFTNSHLDAILLSAQGAPLKLGSRHRTSTHDLPGTGKAGGMPISLAPIFCRVGPASNLHTSRFKSGSYCASTDSQFFGQLQLRHAGLVLPDKLLKINVHRYSGFVYDIQTKTGHMVANGIIQSNCRCGWVAMTIEDAAKAGVREAQEWLRTGIEPRHEWVKFPSFRPDPQWQRSTELVGV